MSLMIKVAAEFLVFRVLPAVIFVILICRSHAFAQFRPTSRQVSETEGSRANQLPLSGRTGQTGAVTATQNPTPGTTTSVNTINPLIETRGPFTGSVWGAARAPFSGRLSLREAVGRGIDFNLGEVGLTNVVAESRPLRKIVRSAFLPNISGYLSETVQQLNLGATGFSFDQRISQLIPGLSIPTVVVPFNYFDLRATLTQKVMDITAWKNYGPAKWIVRADDETAEDAEDLIALAGRPDRAGRRRCLSSGDRGESEVGSDARPTGDRRGALSAGSRTAQRRRHRADRPQSRPD